MKRIPAELSALLLQLQGRLPALLKENLVGIQLHGSFIVQSSELHAHGL